MRKIILNLAVSLDGFIEGPNGEIDWLESDGSFDFADVLEGIISDKDAVFYGRISYEMWGHTGPGDDSAPKLKDVYDRMHQLTKYVFSTKMEDDGTGAIFINSGIKERVLQIKEQPGKNIWLFGGGKLITTLLNLDLIDEYELTVFPVILGKGKLMLENIEQRHNLELISAQGHENGMVVLTYRKQ